MKQPLAILLALMMTLTVCTGCGQTPPAEQPSASGAPITVTDQAGNTITLDAPAARIVSGYYISSSACIALGLADRLVGTEEKIEARPIYQLAAPELIGAAANVGNAKEFDLEACLAAQPDLVILPKRAKDYAATLTEMGIAAIVVSPESHDSLTEMIELIAALTGTEDVAAALVSRYDEVLALLESTVSGLSDADKPTVYLCAPRGYLSTAPKEMYQAGLIRSAGGINAGDVLDGDTWVDISYEQMLAMNPDIIIIPTNNMANGQPDYSAEELMADENLAGVTAVKTGAIYHMPAGLEAWDSPVPSGVLGMLWMLETLHPEHYTAEQFIAQASDFYATFYGFEMDSALITG